MRMPLMPHREWFSSHRRSISVAAAALVLGAAVTVAWAGHAGPPTPVGPDIVVANPPLAPGSGSPGAGPLPDSPNPSPTQSPNLNPGQTDSVIDTLRNGADQPPSIRVDADGHVRNVTARPDHPLTQLPGVPASGEPGRTANAFVQNYGTAFGVPAGQVLRQIVDETVPGGQRMVRFQQYAAGLPVLGGQVVVALTSAGAVIAATGEAPDGTPTASSATLSPADAVRVAIRAAAEQLGLDAARLSAGTPELWLFDPRLLGAPGRSGLRPNWQVHLKSDDVPVALVLVDAGDGTASLVISDQRAARSRLVCDLNNLRVSLADPTTYACTSGGPVPVVRREGDQASAVADANSAYDNLGATYDFYKNNLGRDSIDGHGMALRATVRACDVSGSCPLENAFWDGTQMVFGTSFAGADDVVGHELTHGVTQYTSGLFYAFQSGAINEALSDIMGEFMDQNDGLGNDSAGVKWKLGEDLPLGAIRDMADPPAFSQPDKSSSPNFYLGTSDNGGVHRNNGIANKAAFLISDGGTFNGQTITGLGWDKSVQLWYRVEYLLTAGSDYADLAAALKAGCRQLVGYHAITTADCAQVDKAILATEMDQYFSTNGGVTDFDLCGGTGAPVVDVLNDNMESNSGRWKITPRADQVGTQATGTWQYIPSAAIPVSYAHSGTRALYGYSAGWLTGPIGGPVPPNLVTAEITVTLPTDATVLWFAHNVVYSAPNGRAYVEYNDGSGWQDTYSIREGLDQGTAWFSQTRGYASNRVNLAVLAGKTVTFRWRLEGYIDYLLDDVRIYRCTDTPGHPRNVAGALSADRTSAQLSWALPQFAGTGVNRYEVLVTPTVGGVPATVAAGQTTLTVTGLNPNLSYTFTIRAVDTSGRPGQAVTIPLLTNPQLDCRQLVLDPATGKYVRPFGCAADAPPAHRPPGGTG